MHFETMHFDTQTVIALGVLANLAGALARHFFHTPKQQAQIDALQAAVNDVLQQVKGGNGPQSGHGPQKGNEK